MTTKTVNLYTFDELSDKAKEKAREWFRSCESEKFGAFGEIYEPFETAAILLGICFKQRNVRLMGGSSRSEPAIYWQLEGQGQGASFEGSYSYAKGSVKAIKSEFPTNTALHSIAAGLADLQKKYQYKLACVITAGGRDVHKYAMDIEMDNYGQDVAEDDAITLRDLLRDFADWMFKSIQGEYDYRMSDESVDDGIQANEYTFTANGIREN